jgi:hypothetical protein
VKEKHMPTIAYKPKEAAVIRDVWTRAVAALVDDVERWAAEKGWKTKRTEKEINEEAVGRYAVPSLEIDVPEYDGQVVLQPIARVVYGGAGRVDFSVWPTLSRVHLFRDPKVLSESGTSRWTIQTESRLRLKAEWDQQTFYDIVTEWLSEG